jgi:hypothetical protein
MERGEDDQTGRWARSAFLNKSSRIENADKYRGGKAQQICRSKIALKKGTQAT